MNLFFYFIINRIKEMSDVEIVMKYFVCTDESQIEEIRRPEFRSRLNKLINDFKDLNLS